MLSTDLSNLRVIQQVMQPGLKSRTADQGAIAFDSPPASRCAVFTSVTTVLGRVHLPPFTEGETKAQSGDSTAPAIQLDEENMTEERPLSWSPHPGLHLHLKGNLCF